MQEARWAAELLVALRAMKLSCSTCPYQKAMEAGEPVPDDCCDAENCLLTQFNELPCSRMWAWFARVAGLESAGLVSLIDMGKRWSLEWMEAFAAFKSRAAEIERDRQKVQAEFDAAAGRR